MRVTTAPRIRFQAPRLPAAAEVAERFAVAEQARWYSNEGACWRAFGAGLEARLGQGLHCVPLANATLALLVGLRALVGRSPAREVLLPSFTFAATAAAVAWAGLRPVFVDVEPAGWHLDADALAAALAARPGDVAAVLACSTFGMPPAPAQSAAWRAAAAAHGVPVLVDSAAGFGSVDRDGTPLGGQGDAEVFSFHATKPLAIGEGGMLATADAAVADRVRRLANFGFRDGVVDDEPGLNAKLAEWPAATGLVALERFDDVLARRRAAAAEVLDALVPLGCTAQADCHGGTWQFVPVLAPTPAARDAVRAAAARDGLEVRAYYDTPLHRMPAFAGAAVAGSLDVTEDLAGRALSLPMADDQSAADRERIVASVAGALA